MIKYFECMACHTKFAQEITEDKPHPRCPACGSYDVRERIPIGALGEQKVEWPVVEKSDK